MQNHNITEKTKSPSLTFEEFYVAKDYSSALSVLLQNKQHFESGIFHYNLGTTYAKMSDWGPARFHLEKAALAGVSHAALSNNLNFVKSKLMVNDLSTSDAILDRSYDFVLSSSYDFFFCYLAGFVLLAILIGKMKKISWRLMLLSVSFFSVLFLSFVCLIKEKNHFAVALKEIPVLEGPSKIFQEKDKLKAGSKIVLGEFKEGWFFVKAPENLSGWVSKDQLGIY